MTYHNEVQLVRHTEEVTNKLFIYIFKKTCYLINSSKLIPY